MPTPGQVLDSVALFGGGFSGVLLEPMLSVLLSSDHASTAGLEEIDGDGRK